MNEQLIDLKLKKLIELCSETYNYKKIAVVGFILLSNQVDEIGVKLGIKPRDKEKGEKIYEYMTVVNEILENNLNISIFKESMIKSISIIEGIFLRKRGDISLQYIKELISFYYDLRMLDIPDVFHVISRENLLQNSPLKVLSFFSCENHQIKEGRLHSLILQKLKEEEHKAKVNLKHKFDPIIFEKILQIKTIRNSIENRRSGKITVKSTLKDNINYIHSKENIIHYLIIGWFVLFLILGINILFESVIFPKISVIVSSYLIIVFGICLLLILLNRYYK